LGTGGFFLRKVRAKVSDRPTGYLWVEQGKVAASGCPASERQLEWVSKQGVDVVLTLTEDPLPPEWTKGSRLSFTHIPMRDHEPPSLESLEKAASFLQAEVGGGRKVMVHCLAGQGRTMCAIAAYLIKERGMKAEEAIRTLRALRPGAVEDNQEKAVFDFARSLGRGD
jgi:atypical dual specificity phosphatase